MYIYSSVTQNIFCIIRGFDDFAFCNLLVSKSHHRLGLYESLTLTSLATVSSGFTFRNLSDFLIFGVTDMNVID